MKSGIVMGIQASQNDQHILSLPVDYINSLMSTDLEQRKLEG